MSQDSLSQSSHYRLERLEEGIYAAISREDGASVSNAGLLYLGSHTLVFDTFLTPQAASDLAADALRLTGRWPDIVVNSHHHSDHAWGNQVYAGRAAIFSSVLIRQLIESEGTEQLHWFQANAADQLASIQARLPVAKNEFERRELAASLAYFQGLVAALPTLAIRLPDVTFERQMTFYGTKFSAQLTAYEGGHSPSDAVLYLPEQGILFMGDLLFVDCHPYLVSGDPARLLAVLDDLSKLPVRKLVPGHGPVSGPGALPTMVEYVEHIQLAARVGEPFSDAEIVARMPDPYRALAFTEHYLENIRAIQH